MSKKHPFCMILEARTVNLRFKMVILLTKTDLMDTGMEEKHVLEIRRLRAHNATIKAQLATLTKIKKERNIAVIVALFGAVVALVSSFIAFGNQ